MNGWIKLYRQTLDSTIFGNPNLLKIWVWCLLKASHKDCKQMVGLQEVELKKGQFIFGRKKASLELKMTESTVYRYIKILQKKFGNIDIKSNNKYSIVTIVKWEFFQSLPLDNEQQTIQQVNNKRTTSEQQVNTNKNVKNIKNVKNKELIHIPFLEIINYLNKLANKNYRATTSKTKDLIKARFNEKFTEEDFYIVIDKKVKEWMGTEQEKYLRPETLFGTKFEGYLNQPIVQKKKNFLEEMKEW